MEKNYYNNNAKAFFDETVNINLEELYDTFLSYLEKNAHILDAGCGSGRDSKAFLDKGFRVTSFDSSKELVVLASDYIGRKVRLMGFSQLDEKNIYDAVWCCASLLHIPNKKLIDPIARLSNALKEKGIMYLSFKYGEDEHCQDGRHFTDMNETSINELVSKITGLSIIQTWITPDKRRDRKESWFNIILTKNISSMLK